MCKMAKRSELLERDALQNDEDAKDFDREQAGQDKLNLEALRWSAQQATAIRHEIARLKKLKEYENWERSANSRNVSLMAGRVAEKAITDAYVDRFNRELRSLGASRIKVELTKTRTQKGQALHGLRLKGVEPTSENAPKMVFSDGERRVVSLAAFLADVAEKPHAAPFIFDDPDLVSGSRIRVERGESACAASEDSSGPGFHPSALSLWCNGGLGEKGRRRLEEKKPQAMLH